MGHARPRPFKLLAVKHAVDGRAANPEPAGDLGRPHAVRRQGLHLVSPGHGSGLAALASALSLGFGDAVPLSLKHRLALELSECREHGQEQPALAAVGVDPVTLEIEETEGDSLPLQAFHSLQEVPSGARQAVHRGDHEGVTHTRQVQGDPKLVAPAADETRSRNSFSHPSASSAATWASRLASGSSLELRAYPMSNAGASSFQIFIDPVERRPRTEGIGPGLRTMTEAPEVAKGAPLEDDPMGRLR
jgi:hypothetical protein